MFEEYDDGFESSNEPVTTKKEMLISLAVVIGFSLFFGWLTAEFLMWIY